ncbi:histone H1 NDAI_0E02200 [Naumovozyma dairenensis CBS 421]|uniref:Histone H1 n=1 Tax=Naumovozyma dairenensis (strain ATCC 10597 / BCRC 20456 / CBS 421 / NBRC 0211 / NRRL Y-12639) TaxID=1071378 RepID=G0WBB7_NAUDC|nr:hypothetical protein NDAI_0E02200 [Naumovozyma dairenensis CBS 421]CCD25037.1 hypothetical protein NDAI_0E02200 [Naumovozyma dairenensis CBS 421]
MAPKKSTTTATTANKKKESSSSPSGSKSYKEIIIEGLNALKSRKGVSRPSLKKYVKENYPNMASSTAFDHHFNSAIKRGVESGVFAQPKGPSGTLKLVAPTPTSSSTAKKSTTPSATSSSAEESDKEKKPVKKAKKTTTTTTTTTTGATTKTTTATKNTKGAATTTKKVSKPSTAKKGKSSLSSSGSPSYREMIIKSILALNEGKGSSRPALKNYIKDEYSNTKDKSNFDNLFNAAIRKGVENGELSQPKGPSGVIKVSKKGKSLISDLKKKKNKKVILIIFLFLILSLFFRQAILMFYYLFLFFSLTLLWPLIVLCIIYYCSLNPQMDMLVFIHICIFCYLTF